jgi:uncharacterized protein YgiM (DUF1202 family)
MKASSWIGLFSLLAGLVAAHAADKAVVKQARTNARGAASLSSEVVIQLEKGEVVTVLEEVSLKNTKAGEPAKWLRIQLPADTLVWIHAGFIDAQTKTVIPGKLNVRAGPGEHFSVLCRLEKGASVKPVRTVGEWMEIEAPASASVFVAAELLQREEASNVVSVPTKKTTPTPVPTPGTNAVSATNVISIPITSFTKPPLPETNTVNEAFPAPPIPVVPVKTAVPKTGPKKTQPGTPAATNALPTPTPPTPAVSTPDSAVANTNKLPWYQALFHTKPKAVAKKVETPVVPPTPAVAETLPVRIVTREGILQRTLNIQAPAEYVLEHPESGKIINYLQTANTNVPMKLLKGRRVLVSGEEAIDPRWSDTPVLKIETLRTTDN